MNQLCLSLLTFLLAGSVLAQGKSNKKGSA